MNREVEALKKLLNFQYEYKGYGQLRCRSCGALGHEDYSDAAKEMIRTLEECSVNCPFRQAREICDEQSTKQDTSNP